MKLDELIQKISDATIPKYWRFSASDSDCCEMCRSYDGQVFCDGDSTKPKLPLHPNCRCKYERVEDGEIEIIKKNIENMSVQIDDWTKKILAQGKQLLRDADSIMTEVENTRSQIVSKALAIKISITITSLQYTIAAAEKIKSIEETLEIESNKLQIKINHWSEEIKTLTTAIPDYIAAVRKIHYPRLNDADQQLQNLPQSPQEAIMRGFTKAQPNENWYHRGKGQIDNEKYYHKITGQEVVFDKKGKIVTDPENIGTKNYGTKPKSLDHIMLDIIPYYIWGISPEDTTPFLRRIFGYH